MPSGPGRIRVGWTVVVAGWGLLLGSLAGDTPIWGDGPPPAQPDVEELTLPLEAITRNELGDRHPIALADYRRLLAEARESQPGTPGAEVVSAEYTANFDKDTLQAGRCTLQVASASSEPRLLALDPLQLAVRDLAWSDGPAIWGLTPDGRVAVVVDRPEGELTGVWELQGRTLGDQVHFDFQAARSAVTRLTVRVPEGRRVVCMGGKPALSEPDLEKGWNTWQIDLGSVPRCGIRVAPLPVADFEPESRTCVNQETEYSVRPEGLRIQTDYQLEVLQAPRSTFELAVDADVQIYSVSYGADAIAWHERDTPAGRRLSVTLPDPLLGLGRIVRVRGIAPLILERDWNLPAIRLLNGIFRGGMINLRVQNPLELKSHRSPGLRQIEIDLTAADGEQLRFRQFQNDSQLEVVLGSPPLKVSARVSTEVLASKENWSLTSQVAWTARAGSEFVCRCRLPAGWELTDVRSEPTAAGADLSSWDVVTGAEGSRILVLSFLESLSPERPKRVELFARRLPVAPDQPTPVPTIEPIGVDELEMLVSISADSSFRPVLEPDTTFSPVRPEDLAVHWTESDFWKPRLIPRSSGLLLLQLNDPVPDGEFYLQSLQTPVDIEAHVEVEFEPEQLVETIVLEALPQFGRTERLLVYLREAGPPFRWSFSQPAVGLEARKLPPARHAAWDLPPEGELWEVRLPVPLAEPFTITGSRIRGLFASGRVGLAFVPQANTFKGRADVRVARSLDVQIHPQELEKRPADAAAELEAEAFQQTHWTYDGRDAGFEFRIPQVATGRVPSSIARLSLRSQIGLDATADSLHWAVYDLGPAFDASEFQCDLDPAAELLEAWLNGDRVVPQQEGATLRISGLGASVSHSVVLNYRLPGTSAGAHLRRIVPPQVPVAVLDFECQLVVPPGAWLSCDPASLTLLDSGSTLTWTQRLFGPLGRRLPGLHWFQGVDVPAESVDRPATGRPALAVNRGAPAHDVIAELGEAPLGWTLVRGIAPAVPARLEFEIWQRSEARLWAWGLLLASLAIGAILRILELPRRMLLGTVWMGTCALLALSLPEIPAQMAGAGFAGTLLVALCPRRWVQRPLGDPQSSPRVPPGSTQSYYHLPGTFSAVLLALVIGSQLRAQDAAVSPAPQAAEKYRVLIPVGEDQQPLGSPPLAYAPPRLLTRLAALRAAGPRIPDYLIESAHYDGRVAETGLALTATFEVRVFAEQPRVNVELPLTNVTLGGRDACLLDGAAHPILKSQFGPGLRVELPGGAAVDSASAAADVATAEPGTLHRLQLQLHPLLSVSETQSAARLGIPAVPGSDLRITFATPPAVVQVSGARGVLNRTADSATIVLGGISELRVNWSARPLPAEPLPRVDVWAAAVVDAQPSDARLRYRVKYKILQGKVPAVRWRLPREAAVQSVSAGDAAESSIVRDADGVSWLRVQFLEPRSEDFVIACDLILPDSGAPEQIHNAELPNFTTAGQPVEARLAGHQVAIRTYPEMQVELATEAGDQFSPISVESFLESWGSEEARLQHAYKLLNTAPLKFRLQTLSPTRTFRAHSVGWISERRVRWNYTATVDVQTAPAFQHQLSVDPRLQIASVQVLEEGSSRLLRWSRAGDRLTLFLRDKAIGTQTISVQGTIPLQVPQEFELPAIQFRNATSAESELTLYQSSALAVEFLDGPLLESLEAPRDPLPPGEHGLLVGRYRLPAEPPPLRIRAARNVPEIDCTSVTTLQAFDARWKLVAYLLFTVRQGHGSQFVIRIPPELAQFGVDAPDSTQLQEQESDGAVRVLLLPNQPVRDRFVVSVTASVNIPSHGPWSVPQITLLNAAARENYLVIAPGRALLLADERAAGAERQTLPPELQKQLPRIEPLLADAAAFQGQMLPWQVALPRLPNDHAAPREAVSFSESRVWINGGQFLGETLLWLLPSEQDVLELELPEDLQVRGLSVDGQVTAFRASRAQRLSIPLRAPQSGQCVSVVWSQPGRRGWEPARQLTIPLPHPAEIPVEQTWVTLVAPHADWFGAGGSSPVRTELDRDLARLEAYCTFAERQSDAGQNSNPEFWQLLDQARDNVARSLAAAERNGQQPAAEQRGRADGLQSRIAALPRPGGLGAAEKRIANSDAELAVRIPAALASNTAILSFTAAENPQQVVSLWLADERLWVWGLSALVGLVTAVIGFPLGRLHAGEWLHGRPLAGWLLMALLWWLCLSPAWLALVFLGLAVLHALTRYFVGATAPPVTTTPIAPA